MVARLEPPTREPISSDSPTLARHLDVRQSGGTSATHSPRGRTEEPSLAGRRRNPDLLPRAPGPSQRGGYTAVDERSILRRAGDATASWDENDSGGDAGAWRPRGRRRSI